MQVLLQIASEEVAGGAEAVEAAGAAFFDLRRGVGCLACRQKAE